MSHQRARMQWLRSLADFNLVTNRYWKVPHVAKRQKDVDTWYRGSNTHILDTVQLSTLDWSWYHWYTQTAGCPAAYCQSMQEQGDKFWRHTKACMLIQGRFAVAAKKIENPSGRQHAGKLLKFAALRILIKYSFWLDEALFFLSCCCTALAASERDIPVCALLIDEAALRERVAEYYCRKENIYIYMSIRSGQ